MRLSRVVLLALFFAALLSVGIIFRQHAVMLFLAVLGGAGVFACFMLLLFRAIDYKPKETGLSEIDQMSGEEFEGFLVQLFRDKGATANKTKQSRDYGADILLVMEGKSIAVQAKRYGERVGVAAVQEVSGARMYYGTDEAWIITNNYFTHSARELALSCNVRLLDRIELQRLLVKAPDESSLN